MSHKGLIELAIFIFLVFGLILLIPGVVLVQWYPTVALFFGLGLLFIGVVIGYCLGRLSG